MLSKCYFSGLSVRESSICTGRHCFYVVGGRANGASAKQFDVTTNQWNMLPEMNKPRRCPGEGLLKLVRFFSAINISMLVTKMMWQTGRRSKSKSSLIVFYHIFFFRNQSKASFLLTSLFPHNNNNNNNNNSIN